MAKVRDRPQIESWCHTCGQLVTGCTTEGELITLSTKPRVYVLVGDHTSGYPRLVQSRGYVEHGCRDP